MKQLYKGKKTILFIHHGKGLGGAPLSLLYLIQGLDKQKYHPIVLFLHNSEVIALYQSHGIQTEGPLAIMDFPHTKIWWLRWYHATTIARTIKDFFKTVFLIAPKIYSRIKPDLVHLNTSSLVAWARVAKKYNIPVVWHIREPLASGYCGLRKTFITQNVSRYANTIVAISKNDALPWHTSPKTHVLANIVGPTFFNQNTTSDYAFLNNDPRPKVLFLGGMSQEKGTLSLLKICAHLKNHINFLLIIAGYWDTKQTGAYSFRNLLPSEQFKKQVSTLADFLADNIHITGPVKNVAGLMQISNVIVFPATVGHFARPIIEAGYMQKPVVASNLPPLDELVINGKTGFLINPTDIAGWSEKILLLLSNTTLAKHMGKTAYDFCSNSFNQKNYAASIEKIYSDLLTERTPP